MGEGRRNREPDFLICHEGRWGILQGDGEPYHPPTRAVQDHEWDRLFMRHGVQLGQHYDGAQCRDRPDEVVATFLTLLRGR